MPVVARLLGGRTSGASHGPWGESYNQASPALASTAIPLRPSYRRDALAFRGLGSGAFPGHGCGTHIATIEELS
jgi:hypothetical protein